MSIYSDDFNKIPYTYNLSTVLVNYGEFASNGNWILNPAPHPFCLDILVDPHFDELNKFIRRLIHIFDLPGIKPFDHGPNSIILLAGDKIIKLSREVKKSRPKIPEVLQAIYTCKIGIVHIELFKKVRPGIVSTAGMLRLKHQLRKKGYNVIDTFERNFAIDENDEQVVVDPDAIELIAA